MGPGPSHSPPFLYGTQRLTEGRRATHLEINRAREPHPALGPIPQQTQDTPGRLPSDSASSLPRDMVGIWRIKRLSPRKISPAHFLSGRDSGQLGDPGPDHPRRDTHSHLAGFLLLRSVCCLKAPSEVILPPREVLTETAAASSPPHTNKLLTLAGTQENNRKQM